MRLHRDDTCHEGRAIDLADGDPHRLARAVAAGGEDGDESDGPRVEAPPPGPVVRRCSPLTPGTTLSLGPTLAAVARSRGRAAPQDEALATVERELAVLDPPAVDRRAVRRRLATVGDREERLHERVAELRGRLDAHRDRDDDPPADLRRRMQRATAELTEVRTDRLAAEQRLDRLERRARAVRDDRERRLALEDRRDNLRRAVRRHFRATLAEEFAAALRAVPGPAPPADPYDVDDDLAAATAAVRLADVSTPVVVAGGRFDDAATAARTLCAPVVRVPPPATG